MPLSVLHIGDEVFIHKCFSGIGLGKHLLQGLQNDADDLDILLLVVSADIVGFKQSALFLHHIDCLRVILHIQPVAHILSVAVDGKLLALQCIVDDQRNQLLGELIGSVVVGAVRDIRREMIGIHVRLHQHVRACLARRIRAVGVVGRRLIEEGIVVIGKRAVYLIGRNMQEFLPLFEAAVGKLPGRLSAVEHHGRAQHIGLDEHFRIADASVDMALRREMNHSVNVVLGKNLRDGFLVADIGFHKCIIGKVLDIFEVL